MGASSGFLWGRLSRHRNLRHDNSGVNHISNALLSHWVSGILCPLFNGPGTNTDRPVFVSKLTSELDVTRREYYVNRGRVPCRIRTNSERPERVAAHGSNIRRDCDRERISHAAGTESVSADRPKSSPSNLNQRPAAAGKGRNKNTGKRWHSERQPPERVPVELRSGSGVLSRRHDATWCPCSDPSRSASQ